ncbi:hypothetical protein DENSPDRAFT_843239 [Dentipellis sp. KUC8613]|nr:hypothetical protein DENSPDRAFT_843239 [Dentipellis sp. KUC8613]
MALLMQQRERIKALRMIGPYAEPAVAFLNTQYRSGLPLDKVEHLRLSGPAVQPDSAHLQPQPLELLGMSPSLIQLRDVSIVPHPALLGNLKEFRSRAGLHWTLSQLISALDSMPRLEALSLEFPFRSPDTSPNVSDDAPDRHVLLPRLSTLKFIGHDADSVAFFSHVRMPLQAEVVLEVPTIVGLPLSPWFGRHVDLLSVDFCPESTIGLEIRFQAGLFPSPTIPGFGPTLSSNSAKLQIRKSFSEMIGDVIGFFAACDFTGVEALNITLRVEPNMERPGVKQLFQAVREHFPSLQQLLVVGATGEQVMHLVRTSDREPEVPFLHLTSLFVECHELQKQHPSGKGVAKLHYLVKDVADCFKSRWVQHQTAALENLAINGERIDPAVLDFYASYTCGTVNVQGDFGVPDVCHDVNALQAFLSSANLSL